MFAAEPNLSFLAGIWPLSVWLPWHKQLPVPTPSQQLPAPLQGALRVGPLLGSMALPSCSRAELASPRASPAALLAGLLGAQPPQKSAGLVCYKVWALTQHSCSPSLKALYAGMNSFSHGDLKALLTKWVTFLGIFIRLVSFCHARQLLWNFRLDITRTQCGILAFEL